MSACQELARSPRAPGLPARNLKPGIRIVTADALDTAFVRPRLDSPALARGLGPTGGLPVHIAGLRRSFGGKEVLRGIDLTIEPGQFVAIVGRSGCGKSTLLRLLTGLDAPNSGTIRLGSGAWRWPGRWCADRAS